MKQTSSALTFLLAQYRAIFKRAYIKGIASAVILTAGLAAGQAQAVEFYGYTNSIVQGWKDGTTKFVEYDENTIGDDLNKLYNDNLTSITEIAAISGGAITHYSGGALSYNAEKPVFNIQTPEIKYINLMGKTNMTANEDGTLKITSSVDGASLTLGKGEIALNVVRAHSGDVYTGGAVFAGMAMSYSGTTTPSPATVSVTNSDLTVKDGYYADDAVIAGYAVHALSGTASVSGNTLNYTSNVVKQAATDKYDGGTIGIPSEMLAGGFARSAGGSADAKSNHMFLTGDADNPTAITEKSYFGGGYATLYNLASSTKTNNSVEASSNTAALTNLSYNATTASKEAFIFGGFAKNQSATKVGVATASNNELNLTDVAITTTQTDTAVNIYGGYATNNKLSNESDGDSTVKALGNKLTIDAKATDGTAINMASVTDADKGATIVGGLAEQSDGSKNVTVEASNNTLTIQGNVKLNNVDLYAARAVNSVTNVNSGGVTTAVGNVLNVTGNAVLKDTSIVAAAVKAVDATNANDTNKIVHEGNKAIVDSSVLVIATDGKTVDIAGDTTEIKGSVWAQTGGTVAISGIIKEGAGSNTFFTGTGSLTGTIYNQGTVNVHNELDISQGKIYALADKAVIHVDGTSSKFADSDVVPMTEGYATLKTTEQQIKDYLTAGSATNITLPVENKDDKATVVDKSSAGMLKITSGGTVDFGTEVTLSNFNFSNTDAAGAVVVQSSDSKAYFKAGTINVEHALAQDTTTQTDISKLTAANTTQVHLVANTLNLGSATLTSANSEAIKFADATFRDQLTFAALDDGEANDGFHLVSNVIGDHYKVLQQQGTSLEDIGTPRYEALSGIIEGDATIKGTSGSITIRNGNYTADGAITLASGGKITVGGDDGIEETGTGSVATTDSPDATLTLGQALTFDLSDTGADVTVTVEGAQTDRYDAEAAAETLGNDRHVVLDLRQGITVLQDAENGIGISGAATLEAKSGGEILLTATNLNSLLAQNRGLEAAQSASGSLFKASSGGAFIVEGDVDATFDDFNGGTTDKHGITLSGGGYFVADTLTIDNAAAKDGVAATPDADYVTSSGESVDWGSGTVVVQELEISDLQLTTGEKPEGASSYASSVTLAQGTAQIGSSLLSLNHTLKLGNETTSGNIVFETTDATAEGSINVAHLQVDKGSIQATNGIWNGTNTDVTLSGDNTTLSVAGDFDEERAASLTLNNITMTGATTSVTVGEAGYLNAVKLTAGDSSTLTVNAYGAAEFDQVDFSALGAATAADDFTQNAPVSVRGHLLINGDLNATTGTGEQATDDPRNGVAFGAADSIRIFKNGTLEFGQAAVDGAILDTTTTTRFTGASSITLQKGYYKITNQGGILKLDFASGTAFDNESITALKNALFTSGSFDADGVLENGGILHIGSGSFTYLDGKLTELTGEGLSGWTGSWSDLKAFSDISSDVANYQTLQTNVSGIEVGVPVKGNWGSLSMIANVGDKAQVTLDGHTTLSYAVGNNGFFISDSARQIALGAKVEGNRTLTLVDGGKIGKVSLHNAANGIEQDTVLEVTTSADNTNPALTTIDSIEGYGTPSNGIYGGTVANFRADAVVTNAITGIAEVNAFTGADVTVKNTTAVGELSTENGSITVTEKAQFGNSYVLGGSITAQNAEVRDELDQSLEEGNEIVVAHNGLFKVNDTLTVQENADAVIRVGIDTSWWSEEDLTLEDGSLAGGTGYFEVGTLELNNGTLIVDPEYTEATSIAAVGEFYDRTQRNITYDNYKGQLDGDLLIGKNAAFGLGATVKETQAAIAQFQVGNALDPEKYGSILYLNGQLDVDAGSHIALNSSDTATSEDDILGVNIYNVSSESSEVGSTATDRYAALGLGANTAIIMTNQAFEDAQGEKTGTAIYFNRTNAAVKAGGGEIILAGDFDLSDNLNIFQDKDAAGQEGVDIKDGSIKVKTLNGFLYTILEGDNQGYGVKLDVNRPEAYGIMSEASDPVVETLIAYAAGVTGGATTPEEPTTPENPETPSTPAGEGNQGAGTQPQGEQQVASRATTEPLTPIAAPNAGQEPAQTAAKSAFLERVVVNTHGAPAEQAARLGVYGGAAQAGLAAAGSNSDVLESRFGIGANAQSLNLASNGMGGTLWVAPIYKSQDSDGFGAQGLEYGVDFDLYGVALGGDYKVTKDITVGAMFNVGSGSVDGQGNAAAAGTSNDFDYFGFALYGAYQAGALTVTGDLSYTQVDNDLEGNNEVGKLTASADTSAWSLGVTGQYAFSFASIDVTPHAGLRFTSLDLDDYSLEAAGYGNVARYDGDTLSVFSIPVGVTFAKTIEGESWNVTPALDLHVTGQFGDDEAEGTVAWSGTNLSTNVSSEIFDSFTYGATVGLQAESNSFSFGVGLGYTGSSNTDEFSAQANARFTF